MRRVEYLRHLRASVRSKEASKVVPRDRTQGLLLRLTPATESALAAIMRDIGLTEEQVIKRFGHQPADMPVRSDTSRTPQFG
ncbi:UNVERIFIED_ORG: hypothetical protein M2438_001578 [Methylobacterium sp. SuP10 SLI 274]|nr:hypothetical protein [Methylorubrum extorquens]MDF9791088.1 hypothetical protein [Methylorubrum extorquens]MDF9862792.1 hypothetical protein [Methylorubrum pseudosasae]MDH6636403.1 hypothetical protein [Methylobacterium sp. SuP10 SLI 274]MDH6665583.1 hypothetical protein [Methylorubrum zatmanii]